MKQFLSLFSALIITSTPLLAQNDVVINSLTSTPIIDVQEQQVDFRKEVKPALSSVIVADEDNYLKDWKTYMSTHHAVESKKGSGYMEARMVMIPSWYSDSINVFHKVEKDGDFIRMTLLVECRGTFLSSASHPEAIAAIKTTLTTQIKEFYIKYYDKVTASQQKEYERQLKDHEKLIAAGARLVKEVENAKSSISKAESSISSLKSDISSSENKQKSLENEVSTTKNELDRVKKDLEMNNSQIVAKQKEYDQLNAAGDLDTKKAEKVMKELEKLRGNQEDQQEDVTSLNEDLSKKEQDIIEQKEARNKFESRIREQENSIEKSKGDIRDLEKEIESNTSELATKLSMVDASKEKLERLKTAKAGMMAQ